MNKKPSLSSLYKYAGKYKVNSILGCILSGVSAIFNIAPYIILYSILKEIFMNWPNFDADKVIQLGWMAMALSAGAILVYFVGLLLTHSAAFRIANNMKQSAIAHIFHLPMGYFDTQTSGKLRKIIDDNTDLAETFLAHNLPDAVGGIVMPFAIIITLFVFDYRLGLLCLLPIVLSIVFMGMMFVGESKNFMQQYMDSLEEMNAQAVEYVRGIPVVKVFAQTIYSFKNFHKAIEKYKEFACNYALISRIPMVGYTICNAGAPFFLVPAAILLLYKQSNPLLFLLDFCFYALFSPLVATMMSKLMYMAQSLSQAFQAVERLENITREQVLEEPMDSKSPKHFDVCFEHVTFRYDETKEPAVDQVSFEMKEGSLTALVGPSGGGKSTVAKLLPRFFPVDKGKISIGGIDISNIRSEELMKDIAFVFQDTHLFKESIRENLRIAKPDATEEELRMALQAAECEEIIEKLPHGMDTVIGEKETYLSGGESQRIAIARAILKDAPIVVLDEATAFADSENEAAIQKSLVRLMKGKTVLMIAHRLSTVSNADQILVLESGKIVEKGKHDVLVASGGLYAKMWKDYQTSISWDFRKVGA